jgi:tetratricopeptide (TPR) repeat protein
MNIEDLWEYSDPAQSEARFREVWERANGDTCFQLEIETQIARTYSLRKRFDEAHAVLDAVLATVTAHEASTGIAPKVRIRYLLERGRTYNSSGETEKARALFIEAWEMGKREHWEGLAVDAAHMVAITYSGTEEAIVWNERGLERARVSQDTKAQALIPAMLNNTAWDLHTMGRFADALPAFEEALAAWTERGKVANIQIARWSVARCLRSLGRFEEALAIQHALKAEHEAAGTMDAYVLEEIGANLTALDDATTETVA